MWLALVIAFTVREVNIPSRSFVPVVAETCRLDPEIACAICPNIEAISDKVPGGLSEGVKVDVVVPKWWETGKRSR